MFNGTELLTSKINVVTPENLGSYANPSKLSSSISPQLFYSGVSFTFGLQNSCNFFQKKKKRQP